MNLKKFNNTLIILILILSVFATIYGIFSNQIINGKQVISTIYNESVTLYGKGLYHNESVSMAAQVKAQDLVTLLIAIPFLATSLILNNKNSIRGKFLLTGTLGYFLYTYASYCFVSMYNNFFIVYILLFGLSFFAFTINFTSFDLKTISQQFQKLKFRKYLAFSIIFLGGAIGMMWLGRIIPALFDGIPSGLEHYTTLPIQAIDLGIIVPTTIMAGILLIRKNDLGYLLASIIIIKGITMLLAIDAMAISMILVGASISIIELVVFPFFTILYCFNLYLLIIGIRKIQINPS